MKTICLLAAIMFFICEVVGRKFHKNKICDNGDLGVGQKCTWKACGSECREGLTCENTRCLVKYGENCEGSYQCISDHYCNRSSKKCFMVPYGSTRGEMDDRLQQ